MLESIFCARSRISPASRCRRAVSITCRSTRRWRVSRIPREPSSRCKRPGASWTLMRSPVETRCAGVAAIFAHGRLYQMPIRRRAKRTWAHWFASRRFDAAGDMFSLTWRGDRGIFVQGAFARHGGDDLAAVEAAVFDENFAGVHSADDYTRDVNARHVAFEAFGIRLRFLRDGVEADSLLLEKFEVGMVAGHRENLSCGQGLLVG